MGELKRCPFCGCEMKTDKNRAIFGEHSEDCYFYFIDNQNRFDFTKKADLDKLISAWEKRAEI